jgi:hypothetical protein
MERLSNYREKYLKYKSKYLELKKYELNGPKYNMKGGDIDLANVDQIDAIDSKGNMEMYVTLEESEILAKDIVKDVQQYKELVSAALLPSQKKELTLKTNAEFITIHDKIRGYALKEGRRLYSRWLKDRRVMIAQILSNFDDYGNVKPDISTDNALFFNSATWFNDLYKWTMYPVMRFIEQQAKFKGRPIHVKFQVDIREPKVRKALNEKTLHNAVFEALQKLTKRTFERDVFEQVSKEKGNIISKEDIDELCYTDKDKKIKRCLVQSVSDKQDAPVPVNGVVIRCFYRDDLYYDVPKEKEGGLLEKVGEPGLLVIEAEGPWHLVTWLETSMMQCVYETYHKYNLATDNVYYNTWLSKALLRCATSVAYTRIMQICGGPTPALFTGRRTGGLPFLILQNLFFIDHFKQFLPPASSKPTIGLYSELTEATACLGTSSVDAVLFLRTQLLEPDNGETRELMKKDDPKKSNVLPFVGTHAHELSMVLSVLYHNLDVNPLQLPFSQVLGHYLYEELVRKKTLGPLPMLSDTLGTPAFVLAASILLLNNYVFLSFVNSARQDSGDLVDFETILDTIGYKGGCMASEIDDTATLLKSSLLTKYKTFGAGGYFGDSNKVFDENGINISMAVKVVRVECVYDGEPLQSLPSHIKFSINVDGGNVCIGYPIKTGDSTDVFDIEGRQQIGKFSADKTLPDKELIAMKKYAISTRENATNMLLTPELRAKAIAQIRRGVISISGTELIIDTTPLQSLVSDVAQEVALGGGKYKNKKTTRK